MPKKYRKLSKHERKTHNRVPDILHWMINNGKPATVEEIAKGTGIPPSKVQNTLQRRRMLPIFNRVDKIPQHRWGMGAARILWTAWEEDD